MKTHAALQPQYCGLWWRCRALGAAGVLALALGALSGCGHSPPTQFFTLMAVRADGPAARFAGSPVQVGAVHIPQELDRPQRVIATTGARLDILEQQRWGGPLNDMIQRVLTQDLMTRLPSGMVLSRDMPAPPNTRRVVVDIEEFQPEPQGRVVLDVSWTVLTGPGNSAGARAMQRLELASAGDADAQVGAMSQLVGRLADAIASTLMKSS